MKGRAIHYSAEELTWLEENRTMPRADLHRLFFMLFGREEVSPDHIKSLCWRKGWLTGRTGCFEAGLVPHNKGRKMPFNPNSARTQFKKGNLPHNTHWLGHERVSKDGYVEISVDETNPYTGFERRYVLKHRYLWEKANGPLPDGMCLKCLDGDKTNTEPSNWEAIPRAMLPRLAGRWTVPYDSAPNELKPTILSAAKLKHRVSEIRKRGADA
ncbi:MAG TPA: HNH endonuclease [Sphingomonas sp.]|nr:HNH endonuclease [Sphingomonas sp.]